MFSSLPTRALNIARRSGFVRLDASLVTTQCDVDIALKRLHDGAHDDVVAWFIVIPRSPRIYHQNKSMIVHPYQLSEVFTVLKHLVQATSTRSQAGALGNSTCLRDKTLISQINTLPFSEVASYLIFNGQAHVTSVTFAFCHWQRLEFDSRRLFLPSVTDWVSHTTTILPSASHHDKKTDHSKKIV